MKYYDRLIIELSKPGRTGFSLPASSPGALDHIPASLRREAAPRLPEVSEADVVRHYTNLSQMNFGVDTGFYPLGSCTMKYNPKINEEIPSLFQGLHPLQDKLYKGGFFGALETEEGYVSFCVTEKRTRAEIEALVALVKEA